MESTSYLLLCLSPAPVTTMDLMWPVKQNSVNLGIVDLTVAPVSFLPYLGKNMFQVLLEYITGSLACSAQP